MGGISSIGNGEKTVIGNPLCTGEHWINYLRPIGRREDSAMVSIYHGHWSPVGSGTVAYVHIAGSNGSVAACIDAPAFEEFIQVEMYQNSDVFSDLSIVPADFPQEAI